MYQDSLIHALASFVLAEVESHPFDLDTMLFMDWRDDHLADLPEVKARNDKLPTFLYAMPFTKNKVRVEREWGQEDGGDMGGAGAWEQWLPCH